MSIVAGGNIITITQGGILYRDNERKVCWLDFGECLLNQPVERRVHRYVGEVNPINGNYIKVGFYVMPPLAFGFESFDDYLDKLLKPLLHFEWFLFDWS